jgi:hypothetical protein
MDEQQPVQEAFFGKPGDPIPSVDPAELERFWRISEDFHARFPNTAIDQGALASVYGPLTNANAVWFRASLLWGMRYFGANASKLREQAKEPKDLEEVNAIERWFNTEAPTEPVLAAMSKVSLTWPTIGSNGIPSFDIAEFVRLCEGA